MNSRTFFAFKNENSGTEIHWKDFNVIYRATLVGFASPTIDDDAKQQKILEPSEKQNINWNLWIWTALIVEIYDSMFCFRRAWRQKRSAFIILF